MKHKDLTDKIIQAFYKVYNNLRYGFLEKVYENAMMIELKKGNLSVISQSPIRVYYDEKLIGEYYADLLIDDK
ncbi:MAG: GxxExxY protein, partial [Desulfobacteraceae bacterium]